MPSPDPVSDPAFEAFDATRDGWPPLADGELHLWLLPHRRGRPSIDALRRQAVTDGMRPLRLAGALKVAAGLTTIEEILSTTPPLS